MDVAEVYDWFAQESRLAAEQTNEPMQREMFLRLALMWATAAQQSSRTDEAWPEWPTTTQSTSSASR
jgi:hypothetical protein